MKIRLITCLSVVLFSLLTFGFRNIQAEESILKFNTIEGTVIKSEEQYNSVKKISYGNGLDYVVKLNYYPQKIKYINPQGTAILMGVSENKVPINTRNILEKGLTFMGSSRSGREDFLDAVNLMEDYKFQQRLCNIITEDNPVSNISDIHRVFSTDLNTPFKTVFKWDI